MANDRALFRHPAGQSAIRDSSGSAVMPVHLSAWYSPEVQALPLEARAVLLEICMLLALGYQAYAPNELAALLELPEGDIQSNFELLCQAGFLAVENEAYVLRPAFTSRLFLGKNRNQTGGRSGASNPI